MIAVITSAKALNSIPKIRKSSKHSFCATVSGIGLILKIISIINIMKEITREINTKPTK